MTFPFPTFCPAVAAALAASEFIGAASNSAASGMLSWPAGTIEGDIAFIVLMGNSAGTISSPSGWTSESITLNTTNQLVTYRKVLTAGDISSPPSYTTSLGFGSVYVYRGGTSISFRAKATGAGDIVLTGFKKSSKSRRVVTVVSDRDPGSTPSVSGFVARNRFQATNFMISGADAAPDNYTDEGSVTWSSFLSSLGAQAAMLFEITNNPAPKNYYAYGDSNTIGTLVTTPYPNLIVAETGDILTNRGVSGDQAADQSMDASADTITANDICSILIGGNDQWQYGTDPVKTGYYEDCLRRLVLECSAINRVGARNGSMTKTGSWSNTAADTQSMTASTIGAKASATVNGETVWVGFILQDFAGISGSAATVKVDGVLVDTISSYAPGLKTYNANTVGAAAIRIGGLSAGAHTVEVELTAATSFYLSFIAGSGDQANVSKVYLGSLIDVLSTSTVAGYYSAGRIDTYNAMIADIAADAIADGLNLTAVTGITTALISSDYQSDGVHPTNAAHQKLADEFLAVW